MRFLAIAGLAVLLIGTASGCGSSGNKSGNTGAATTFVDTINNASAPMGFSFTSPVTVRSGAKVQWRNQSAAAHNIVWDAQTPATSPAPGANIGTFGPAIGALSSTWTAPTVTASTNYAYHCGIHGPTMAGIITVNP